MTPAVASMASLSIVLPEEAWPTMAKLRISAAWYSFIIGASAGRNSSVGKTNPPQGTSENDGPKKARGRTNPPPLEGSFDGHRSVLVPEGRPREEMGQSLLQQPGADRYVENRESPAHEASLKKAVPQALGANADLSGLGGGAGGAQPTLQLGHTGELLAQTGPQLRPLRAQIQQLLPKCPGIDMLRAGFLQSHGVELGVPKELSQEDLNFRPTTPFLTAPVHLQQLERLG